MNIRVIKIALVDSDPEFFHRLSGLIENSDEVEIAFFQSTDKATENLEEEHADLLVFNLDGLCRSSDSEEDPTEPIRFLDLARAIAPKLQILCLARGDVSLDKSRKLLEHSHHDDALSTGRNEPTIALETKRELGRIANFVSSFRQQVKRINALPVNTGGKYLGLLPLHLRILRSFCARFGGVSCNLEKLSVGVSGAVVFKVVIVDENGSDRIHAISKIDSLEKTNLEFDNYQREVSRLPTGNYPAVLAQISSPSAGASGVFFRLLMDDEPLAKLALSNPHRAAGVVVNLEQCLSGWHSSGSIRTTSVREIRQILLDDEKLEDIIGDYPQLSWFDEIETRSVISRWGCCHADLHAGNVFVNADGKPVLIDFADIVDAPSALDPITLELSLYTHKPMYAELDWLPEKANMPWYDLDTYSTGCKYEEFIKSCRVWAHSVSGGDDAVKACAYSYLIRQLKYPDTDHNLILMLLDSIYDSFTAMRL